MRDKENVPWASGPKELLKHGLGLLSDDSDSNRRIAMICIDNSVELMIKTFLGLPKRLSGITMSRKEFTEASENFPSLLDALEKYATDKITGIDIGEIEWFHRLRNELYHQGNGLTVERKNAEVYAEIANLLFYNLFGIKLVTNEEDSTKLLGHFMEEWIHFEKTMTNLAFISEEKIYTPLNALKILRQRKIISDAEFDELNTIRGIRNEIVHGKQNYDKLLTADTTKRLKEITFSIRKKTLKL